MISRCLDNIIIFTPPPLIIPKYGIIFIDDPKTCFPSAFTEYYRRLCNSSSVSSGKLKIVGANSIRKKNRGWNMSILFSLCALASVIGRCNNYGAMGICLTISAEISESRGMQTPDKYIQRSMKHLSMGNGTEKVRKNKRYRQWTWTVYGQLLCTLA